METEYLQHLPEDRPSGGGGRKVDRPPQANEKVRVILELFAKEHVLAESNSNCNLFFKLLCIFYDQG